MTTREERQQAEPTLTRSRDASAVQLSSPAWAWVIWVVCVLTPLLGWATPSGDQSLSLAVSSVGALVYGALLFWFHGGSQVTAAGLYAISSSMFVGFAGLTWAVQDTVSSPRSILVAVAIDLWTMAAMHLIFWRRWAVPVPLKFEKGGGVAHLAFALGVLASAGVLMGESRGWGGGQIAAGVLALAIISVALLRTDPRRVLVLGAIVAGLIVAFALTVFSGFGRLVLVSLALLYVVIVSGWFTRKWVKFAALLGVGPLLAVFVRMREGMVTSSSQSLDGLGSVVNPLRDLGLVEQAVNGGTLGPGYGSTFFATLVSWVPRSVWPEKPIGFGSVLTDYFHPELRPVGYSMAAHSSGEWIFNFGMLGLVLMALVIGFLVQRLDRELLTVGGGRLTHGKFLTVAVVVVLAAEIPSLMWVGSFTFTTRVLQKLVPLLMISVLLPIAQGRGSASARPEGRRARLPARRSGSRPMMQRN